MDSRRFRPTSATGNDLVNAHLSVADVAAVVDGPLSPEERAAVESHLAVCAECRDEVVTAMHLVETAPQPVSPRRRRWAPFVGLAAAAAVLIVALPLARSRNTRVAAPEQRAAAPSASIVTVSPRPAARVAADSLGFVWHADSASTYRLTVTDSAGAEVYSVTTGDTSVRLPPTVRLAPGASYFWFVDALRPDGSSISSHSTAFSLRP